MKKLVIFLLFVNIMILLSDDFSNDFGMNEDWKLLSDIYDVVESNNLRSYQKLFNNGRAHIFFKDSLHGIVQYGFRHFINKNSSYDMTYNIFYTTNDGGLNWKVSYIDSAYQKHNQFNIACMDFSDNGLYCGVSGWGWKGKHYRHCYFVKSNDYGKSWTFDDLGFSALPKNIQILNKDTIFALFDYRAIKSIDGGETWINLNNELDLFQFEDNFNRFYDLDIASDSSIFITASYSYGRDKIWRSTDGGSSWDTFEWPAAYVYSIEALDRHTWYGHICDFADLHYGLIKCSNDNQIVDTLIFQDKKPGFYGALTVDNEKIFMDFGYDNKHISTDGGKTFESLVDREAENFIRGEYWTAAWPQKGRTILVGYKYFGIMIHRTPASIELEKLTKFESKVFPNPANQDSPLYIELQNESARSVNCKIYNSAGELIKQSKDMFAPKGWHIIDFTTDGMVSGSYFLIIESNGEILAREKFIVK